jgi:hypothetical protein
MGNVEKDTSQYSADQRIFPDGFCIKHIQRSILDDYLREMDIRMYKRERKL